MLDKASLLNRQQYVISLIRDRPTNANITSLVTDTSLCCLLDGICGRLIPLGPKGKVGVPYLISGTDMIAKLSPASLSIKHMSIDHNLGLCNSERRLPVQHYIALDELTNETIIGAILNYVEGEKKLPPLFVKHYYGMICPPNTGCNIMEYADMGTLSNIAENPAFYPYLQEHQLGQQLIFLAKEDILQNILTQLTVALYVLQKHVGFVSGDLKAGNIFLKSEPINITYEGISIKAPFTCKIADYGKSSCTFNGVRYYNENLIANAYLYINPYTSGMGLRGKEEYYQIGSANRSYAESRHGGIPYYESFDYYTMIISLLMNPPFYYIFWTSNLRTIFWDPLWYDNEGNTVQNKIYQHILAGTGHSIKDAVESLVEIKLKCNAIDLIINNIRK